MDEVNCLGCKPNPSGTASSVMVKESRSAGQRVEEALAKATLSVAKFSSRVIVARDRKCRLRAIILLRTYWKAILIINV